MPPPQKSSRCSGMEIVIQVATSSLLFPWRPKTRDSTRSPARDPDEGTIRSTGEEVKRPRVTPALCEAVGSVTSTRAGQRGGQTCRRRQGMASTAVVLKGGNREGGVVVVQADSEAGIAMAVSVALIIRASTWDNGRPHRQPASQPGTTGAGTGALSVSPLTRPPSFEPLDGPWADGAAATLSLQTEACFRPLFQHMGGRLSGEPRHAIPRSLAIPSSASAHARASPRPCRACVLLLLCDKGASRLPGLHFPTLLFLPFWLACDWAVAAWRVFFFLKAGVLGHWAGDPDLLPSFHCILVVFPDYYWCTG